MELFYTTSHLSWLTHNFPIRNRGHCNIVSTCNIVNYCSIVRTCNIVSTCNVVTAYLIFVTCTTCSAGVKISRLVSKNSSNYGYFTYHHHSGGGRVVAPPPPLQHHHHNTLPPPSPSNSVVLRFTLFCCKIIFSRNLRVSGVKFFS